MPVSRLEIVSREPYEDGRTFGDVGAYERIEAVFQQELEPPGE